MVACNVNCGMKCKGLLKATGSHMHCKSVNISVNISQNHEPPEVHLPAALAVFPGTPPREEATASAHKWKLLGSAAHSACHRSRYWSLWRIPSAVLCWLQWQTGASPSWTLVSMILAHAQMYKCTKCHNRSVLVSVHNMFSPLLAICLSAFAMLPNCFHSDFTRHGWYYWHTDWLLV